MPDPRQSFSGRKSDPNGVGPYQFDIPALASGESHVLDLRERERGRYVTLSPAGYDSLEVTNLTSAVALSVTINDTNRLRVPPNTTQGLSQAGMYRFEVQNEGDTATADGDVTLEVIKEPYGADEAARSERERNPVADMVEHFTGLKL